ncbi:helicase associated domain-containing protein [Streptomyces flaveus]|uniref:helicase associated domain-containing protein n=1 Tax=Streptomyces flaveus TaxID=66370 RepID=UPI0033173ED4
MLFADARGSMVDIVQMVGRALRMQPGGGKIATLIVPVFLGPDEDANELLTSDAYGTLAKVLGALRAHDTETIEALADPRVRNSRPADEQDGGDGEFTDPDRDEDLDEAGARVSGAAAGVLRFSEERDPAVLTRFVRLRVIDPEGAYWRRGIEAATRWRRETGSTELRVPYTYVTPENWPGVAGHPLGVWIADQRRYYAAGTLEPERVAELESLGMVWSHQDTAWAEGLSVARSYAAAHFHLLPPATAVWEDYPIGTWCKNLRAAARRTLQNAERRTPGSGRDRAQRRGAARKPSGSLGGDRPGMVSGMGDRMAARLRLALAHVQAGGALPLRGGEVIVQGEDLGAWTAAQRLGWDKLLPAQQWLLDNALGLEPAGEAGQPTARRTQADRWATHLAAARQFHAREGHLRVPRKHVETVDGEAVRLGSFVDNTRRRAAKLSPERRTDLDALDMHW